MQINDTNKFYSGKTYKCNIVPGRYSLKSTSSNYDWLPVIQGGQKESRHKSHKKGRACCVLAVSEYFSSGFCAGSMPVVKAFISCMQVNFSFCDRSPMRIRRPGKLFSWALDKEKNNGHNSASVLMKCC